MKTLTRNLFLLSVVIPGVTFFLLKPQVCFGAPCVGWEAATCMARKAYAEHDPKYCTVANHPWRDCLIGLAVLEGKPEDCIKLTGVEGTCIGSLAAKRLDPKICDYLQDTVAVDYKTQCVVD